MAMEAFDPIWQQIVECEGQQFKKARGLRFAYSIHGQTLRPSRTRYNLSRAEFEKAQSLIPSASRSQLNKAIRGPSYIIAILADPRINGLGLI